jgi:hypothetical protein
MPALHDRVHLRDPALELLHGPAVLVRELDQDLDLERAAVGGRVDLGVVAADDAGLLERAHAPQAGRGREADALGQLDVREAGVAA